MTAFAAVRRVEAGDWVAVHGCGGVGLSAIMLARSLGAAVIAVDVDGATLELARSLGAAHAVDARASDPVEAIAELTGGGAHVSLDALGSATTCANSIRCLCKRGRHVQVGLMLEDDRTAPIPMDRVISYELELRGVHGMAVGHYDALLRLITSGAVDPGRLIGRTIGLADAGAELAAMSDFAQRGVSVIVL
jgi:alcohol dehydrogenase